MRQLHCERMCRHDYGNETMAEEKILGGATIETKEKAFKTFPLRIPLDLHKAATEAAWRNRESLHEFILKLIRKSL